MPRSIQTWIVAVMFITAVSGMSVQTADAGPRTEGAIKGLWSEPPSDRWLAAATAPRRGPQQVRLRVT